MSDQSFARLEQAFAQADLEGPPGRFAGARENRGGLAVLLLHLKEGVQMNWKRVAEGLIWDFAYTLRKQQEAEARAATLEAQVRELQERLHRALDALGGMYCQYTPGTFGHDFMSAGEDAQDVLLFECLLDKEDNFIGMPALDTPPSAAPQQPEQPAPQGGGRVGDQVPGMPQAQCHGCGLPEHVARCRTATCPMKEPADGSH